MLVPGHTRMALGNTRMRLAGTRMALGNTRMDEEDDVLNVVWSLLVRVWGSGTRMRQTIRVWDWLRNGPYAYGTRQYAYGQNCDFSVLLLCSFLVVQLSNVI